ncbi:MAG: 50S ribosomal protein L11 [Geovibrio sp.]|jgi:large subunit ribosomal protein L11|uniref:Large ribosomal subunit protein uL11 n=1 Tax=Geovibrio thiophilus TaxID=139438 RepID=A0A410JX39_9BACT|nr:MULTISPECIES: 50S ribosomal protein L11 [Geovibrio]MCD8493126.1 50S ribosomal protein L11 [Geovibrio sp.]MCD8568405.1 50S ribosomal protein L11 [Geovibrio sp.]QAR32767.1 50S ribosomal protein L11 [Geovibrio thiophilus]
MAKKVLGQLKLQVPAGKANPSPPIGPALGQRGVNIMEFCKSFNAATQNMGDYIIPVQLTIFEDRSFTFVLKTPPVTQLIKKELKINSGSSNPKKDKVGKLTREQLVRIAEHKLPDFNTKNIDEAVKIVAGSARSMGVEVEL